MRPARRLIAPLAAAAVAAAGTLVLVSAPNALAGTVANPVQLTGFQQMVVDSADGYIFFSAGTMSDATGSGSALVVANLAGSYVTTLDSGDGVEGLTLSNGTLYAALSATNQVAGINVASIKDGTPTQITYSLPAQDAPYGLAMQGGDLWVSYNETTPPAGAAGIGDIDLATGTFQADTAGTNDWYSAPELASDPSDTGVLVASAPDEVPATIETFDTAVSPVKELASTSSECAPVSQLAFVPGGAKFIAGCGDQFGAGGAWTYDTASLSAPVSSYAGLGAAVAITGYDEWATGAQDSPGSDIPAVQVYGPTGTKLYDFQLPDSENLALSGLGWSADGATLYAVAQDASGGYSLQTFDVPKPAQATLSLTGPSRVTPGSAFTLSGQLKFVSGASAGGLPVSVVRTNPNGSKTTVAPVYGTDGAFKLNSKLTTLGTYTYTARYAGDATHAAATGTFKVLIAHPAPTLTLSSGSTVLYDSTIKVTAHLGSSGTNRTVSVYYQLVPSTTKHLLKTAKVNSSGNLVLSYPHAARDVIFTATFSGDSTYSATSASARVNAAARLSMTNSGWYTTTKYDGETFREFHQTGYLVSVITLTPFVKGDTLELEIQQLQANGTWTLVETSKSSLMNVKASVVELPVSNLAGAYLRVRAEVVPPSSDITNVGNSTGWFYFAVAG